MAWIIGQSALSGSFWMTPEEALDTQEAAAAVQRDSADWRNGQTMKASAQP